MNSCIKLLLAFLFGCILGIIINNIYTNESDTEEDNSVIDKYKSQVEDLSQKIDSLNNLIYLNECEIDNLRDEIREKEINIDNLNHKYESEMGRVMSLPTDSAIIYLKRRLNEK